VHFSCDWDPSTHCCRPEVRLQQGRFTTEFATGCTLVLGPCRLHPHHWRRRAADPPPPPFAARVGTGVTEPERAAIRNHLKGNLLESSTHRPPSCYKISGATGERPHLWVANPLKSIVVTVMPALGASEIGAAGQFHDTVTWILTTYSNRSASITQASATCAHSLHPVELLLNESPSAHHLLPNALYGRMHTCVC
jgi:hypothetical protein